MPFGMLVCINEMQCIFMIKLALNNVNYTCCLTSKSGYNIFLASSLICTYIMCVNMRTNTHVQKQNQIAVAVIFRNSPIPIEIIPFLDFAARAKISVLGSTENLHNSHLIRKVKTRNQQQLNITHPQYLGSIAVVYRLTS